MNVRQLRQLKHSGWYFCSPATCRQMPSAPGTQMCWEHPWVHQGQGKGRLSHGMAGGDGHATGLGMAAGTSPHHPEPPPCIPQPQSGVTPPTPGPPRAQRTPLPLPEPNLCWGSAPPSPPRPLFQGAEPWVRAPCPPSGTLGDPPGAHHDQPLGDLLGAAVAELPEARPVILLAVEAPILLVVLVGQGGPALAAPAARGRGPPPRHHVPIITLSPSSPRGGSQCPSAPLLSASCFPRCCRATASVCHRPQGGSRWLQCRLAVRGRAGTPGWTG